MTGSQQEVELVSPPSDGITTVAFCPSAASASLLLCSSWDTNLRLHDAEKNFLLTSIPHNSPVLDTCWSSTANLAFSSTLDSSIHCVDLSASALSSLPSPHTDGARCVAYHASSQLLISAGWDGMVCSFDPRSATLLTTCQLPSHIYSLAVEPHTSTIAVAGSNQSLHLFDIRNLTTPASTRRSTLSHQSRCVRIRPATHAAPGSTSTASNCFALCSVRGRVAIDYLTEPTDPATQPFGFKAHTTPATAPNKPTAHAVHAMAFHSVHGGCLATSGGDGSVAVWDVDKRKRLCVWTGSGGTRQGLSVLSLSWSADGRRLAMACGYGWEYGEAGVKAGKRDGIWVRRVEDSEIKRS